MNKPRRKRLGIRATLCTALSGVLLLSAVSEVGAAGLESANNKQEVLLTGNVVKGGEPAGEEHIFGMPKGENPAAASARPRPGRTADRAARADDPRYEKPPLVPKMANSGGSYNGMSGTIGQFDPGDAGSARPAQVNAVALQADGKVVVVGQGFPNDLPADPANERAFVARYNADGTLDSTLLPAPPGDNGNGIVFLDFQTYESTYLGVHTGQRAHDVAIDGDGRIVVVGESDDKVAIARLNPGGTYDTSFNDDGLAVWNNWMTVAWVRATSVAIRGNGHLLIGFESHFVYELATPDYPQYWGSDVGLIPLEPDGEEYENFGEYGWHGFVNPGIQDAVANRITIQDDGRVLQVGRYNWQWIVIRYNLAGFPDPWFDGSDVLVITLPRRYGEAVDVVMAPPVPVVGQFDPFSGPGKPAEPQRGTPEKFLVTGISDPVNVVARFHGNGILDTTFGILGYAQIPGHGMGIHASGITGRITVGGKIEAGYRAFAARFDRDGMAYSPFGSPNGYVTTNPIAQGPALGRDLAVQPNGRPVVAGVGSSSLAFAPDHAAVARWLSDGTADSTWSGDGFVTTAIDRPSP